MDKKQIPINRKLYLQEYNKKRFMYDDNYFIEIYSYQKTNIDPSLYYPSYFPIWHIRKSKYITILRKLEKITKKEKLIIDNFGTKKEFAITKQDIVYLMLKNKLNDKSYLVINHFLSGKYLYKNNMIDKCSTFINVNGYSFNILKKEYNKINPLLNDYIVNNSKDIALNVARSTLNDIYNNQKFQLSNSKYSELVIEITNLLHKKPYLEY